MHFTFLKMLHTLNGSVLTTFYSSIRYDICLEGNPSDDNNMFQFQVTDCVTAPTAAAQKIDEPPLTYLNKG